MRTLILSCNTGQGHNSCAKAIQEAYETNGSVCDIEDALRFISPNFSKFISWGHTTIYRHFSGLFKWGYAYSERHPDLFHGNSSVFMLLTSGTKRMYEFIRDGQYDSVICVHVFSAMILTEMLKQHPMDIKTSFVATDYTCSPSTEQSDLDLYFIPHKILKYDYEHPNIPLSKMVCSGIPIRQMFYHNTSKEEAKKALGIPTNQPHLLLMCGSMGCGPIKHLVRLLSREEGFQMTVVCGTNDKLQKSLQKHYKAHSNIHVRGYEKGMSLLLDSADLYLTKPGGLSVTESFAKNLPMVCIDAVAGCEEYNRNFFLRMGGAKTGRNVWQLKNLCCTILQNPSKLSLMRSCMEETEKGNAAQVIYETMRDYCSNNTSLED